ncbi:fibronectin type III domain-containing protein [Flavobacterium lindanitolerans]|uniref:fibronectin type III domain-containing protein n=1 Tax=Flavobacterium lindanitolerans TaxID=428988 RepID=UPI0031D98DD0
MSSKITSIISIFIFILFIGCSSEDGASGNCGEVIDVSFNVYSSTSLSLTIKANHNTGSFKIEYGPAGFAKGTGVSITTLNTVYDIGGLIPSTSYDIYVTGICDGVENNAFYKLSNVTTRQSRCAGNTELDFFQFNPNELILQFLYRDSAPSHYEVEYGLAGFTLGTGTRISTVYLQKTITDFQMDKDYDFYARTFCSPFEATPFIKYTYRTVVPCPKPTNLRSNSIIGLCDSPDARKSIGWDHQYGAYQNFVVSLIRTVGEAPGANIITTGNNGEILHGPFCEWIGFYVKANCNGGSSSEWAGPHYF